MMNRDQYSNAHIVSLLSFFLYLTVRQKQEEKQRREELGIRGPGRPPNPNKEKKRKSNYQVRGIFLTYISY